MPGKDNMPHKMIDRRSFISFSTLAAAGLLLDDSWLRAADTASGPIVSTISGKLRGATSNKVHAFKGIPMALPPTAPAASFLQFRRSPGLVFGKPSTSVIAAPRLPRLSSRSRRH